MRSPGPALRWKRKPSSNGMAPCGKRGSVRWGPSIAPAPSRSKKKTKWRRSRLKRRNNFMAREIITIECSEARKEGKSPSRYTTTRNKKLHTERMEIKKYNPALRRHTVHKEIK